MVNLGLRFRLCPNFSFAFGIFPASMNCDMFWHSCLHCIVVSQPCLASSLWCATRRCGVDSRRPGIGALSSRRAVCDLAVRQCGLCAAAIVVNVTQGRFMSLDG